MRIVLSLDRTTPEVEAAAAAVAALAQEHEVLVAQAGDPRTAHALELALRNRVPERDVLSVLTQVVVAKEDHEPCAIAEARTLRTLLDAGTLVICAAGDRLPVALAADGSLAAVTAVVDEDSFANLLGRRLEADLILRGNEIGRLVTLAG